MLRPSDFYLFRSPAFSHEDLCELNAAIYNKDIHALKKIYSDTYFLNALFFASKEFYHTVKNWLITTSEFNDKDRILISLYKYYNRICIRSTPYGLFAGFSLGDISEEASKFNRNPEKPFQVYVRPDMSRVEDLIQKANSDSCLEKITFSTNNTLYRVADKLRYIESDSNKNYKITQVQNNDFLANLLNFTENGQYLSDIKEYIRSLLPDAEEDEIDSYITELRSSQVITAQLPPFITSNFDLLETLEKNLSDHDEILGELKNIAETCDEIKSTLEDQKPIDKSNYFNSQHSASDQDFQVDLTLDIPQNKINNRVTQTLLKSVNEIVQLPNAPHHTRITEFKDNFVERFGTEEIALVHALDPQLGVGYDLQVSGNIEEVPLIDHIDFSLPVKKKSTTHNELVDYVQRKFQSNFNYLYPSPIQLEEIDIRNNIMDHGRKRFFSDYYILGELSAENMEELDKGNFKFYCTSAVPRPFMATVLSRFAYYNNSIAEKIRTEVNKNTDCLMAEVVHQPDGRIGNILLRPSFYKHEIAYYSQHNPENVNISINDLYISVNGNDIILKSKSQGKVILPRLSSSHNFHIAQLPMYRFLSDLQYYNMNNGYEWDWGHLKESIYLPRIEYKNLILSEARWKLFFHEDLTIDALKTKIDELKIPQYFKIKDSDNILLLDSKNTVCLNILFKELKDKKKVSVYEVIENSSFIQNDSKHYSSEIILPLIHDEPYSVKNPSINNNQSKYKRSFFPGEEWSYFKIYCSHVTCDNIISEILPNIMATLSGDHIEWFFLRYDDPHHHLRLRIKNSDSNRLLQLLLSELDFYIQNRLIFSITQDTYVREIERYGPETIEDTENFFFHDSICTVHLLQLINDYDEKEEIRYLMALQSVDRILEDFSMSISERKNLMETMFHGFQEEFVDINDSRLKKMFKKSIDKKLRDHKNIINDLLIDKKYENVFAEVHEILNERSQAVTGLADEISGKFTQKDILNWLSSCIHMNLNRIFFTHARLHETIVYFLLYKTYVTLEYKYEHGPKKGSIIFD